MAIAFERPSPDEVDLASFESRASLAGASVTLRLLPSVGNLGLLGELLEVAAAAEAAAAATARAGTEALGAGARHTLRGLLK